MRRTEKASGEKKAVKTEEPYDYHGNVTHVEYENFQREIMKHFLVNFAGSHDPLLQAACPYAKLHLDGARSHKRLLDRAPTKNDNMAEMRRWLRVHKGKATAAGFPEEKWDEDAPGTTNGRISKAALWAIVEAVREVVPRKFVAVEMGKAGDVGDLDLSADVARVKRGVGPQKGAYLQLLFTPP